MSKTNIFDGFGYDCGKYILSFLEEFNNGFFEQNLELFFV